MLNGFLLNPAAAGSEGYTAVNMTAREQWIGINNGPGTYALSFQTRILKKSYISRMFYVKKRQRRVREVVRSESGDIFSTTEMGQWSGSDLKGLMLIISIFPHRNCHSAFLLWHISSDWMRN